MIGDYKIKVEERRNDSNIIGIFKSEDDSKLIAKIDVIKKPEEGIILFDNFAYNQKNWNRNPKVQEYLIREVFKKFDNGEFNENIGLLDGESPQDKLWKAMYRSYGWHRFSEDLYPWIAKGLDIRDPKQIKKAEKVINEIYSPSRFNL